MCHFISNMAHASVRNLGRIAYTASQVGMTVRIFKLRLAIYLWQRSLYSIFVIWTCGLNVKNSHSNKF